MTKRLPILDIWVDPVNMDQAIEYIRGVLLDGIGPHSIFAVNPEKNFSVPKDPALYETFRKADLLIPDGIGIVFAARILHGAAISRVPGVELMENICRLAAEKRQSIYIYGSKEEVNAKAAEELVKRYPSLQVAGRSNGYVKEGDMTKLVASINNSGARVLFLALGSPKQEKWYTTYKNQLENVRICQGIGGTLDTIAGNVKRAPEIWRRFSLEWLYRLLAQPSRAKRQKTLPLFAIKVLCARFLNNHYRGGNTR